MFSPKIVCNLLQGDNSCPPFLSDILAALKIMTKFMLWNFSK
jgi:hypothetical protein